MPRDPRSHRRPIILFAALVAAALLAACSSAGAAPPAPFEGGPVFVGGAPGGSDGERSGDDAAQAPLAPEAGGDVDVVGAAQADDALIVRTGSLQLEVGDFDAALAKARTAVVGLGGYISGSELATDGDRPYGSVTYRIPSERWDDALSALKGISSKVVYEQTQAVEVTAAVTDIEARLENLRATEASLQAIMAQATRIPDILEVQAQLTTVRGQIEQLEAERDHLRDQASYGTLTVGWSVPLVAVAQAQGAWDPAAVVDAALAQLVGLGQGLVTAGIWLVIVGLPLLLVGLALIGLVAIIARRMGVGRRPTRPTEAAASNS